MIFFQAEKFISAGSITISIAAMLFLTVSF